MRLDFLTDDVSKFRPFLETVLQDGGKKLYSIDGIINQIRNVAGMSGFSYQEDGIEAELTVGLILGGTGYVLKRILRSSGQIHERYDYFNIQGDLTFTADKEALNPVIVDFFQMDLSCPILNHFYNYLSLEYKKASEGRSQTQMVYSVERLLASFYKSKIIHLPIEDGVKDPIVKEAYEKILKAELDPVLNWEERQLVFKNYREELNKILSTKIRAHHLNKTRFQLALILTNIANFFARFISRPVDNFRGIFYRYTIGKVIWFFQTVKNNLGYSIALAVYGPFTYYFITMPMNPHAMQAVGKVRSTYLEVKEEFIAIFSNKSSTKNQKKLTSNSLNVQNSTTAIASDSVSTKNAAPMNITTTPESKGNDAHILANIIAPSSITADSHENSIMLGDSEQEKIKAKILNMLLTVDSAKIDQTSWSERMSNMKQMQIAYEENIEYASRMGRLEQLETQYNFPMQVESTWEELERYNQFIFKVRAENPNISAKMKQFLFNEINRTQQLQLYLWDRMGRFILDQIYVMLDQDKEQQRNDYYVGRSFVFMEEMTKILSWRYKDLKKHHGHEKIQKLAEFYSKSRKEHGTILNNLKANSDLFKQKDIFNTKEFRAHMKRQWEILFLQNSKAEEASNNGLNMYIWSVRNTIWVLQSIYSAKREELALLIKRDTTGELFTPSEMLSRSKISMMYETLFHNLTLEYVGIREEIMNRLGKDIESTQRMTVIENLKEFFSDRDKLDNMGMANNQKTAEATL